MYDKGNAIHNNGAKLGNSLKKMNGLKHATTSVLAAAAAKAGVPKTPNK